MPAALDCLAISWSRKRACSDERLPKDDAFCCVQIEYQQREIRRVIGPSVLLGDDVFDVEGDERIVS